MGTESYGSTGLGGQDEPKVDYELFGSVPSDQVKITIEQRGRLLWCWCVDSGFDHRQGRALTERRALNAAERAAQHIERDRQRAERRIVMTRPARPARVQDGPSDPTVPFRR